MITMYRQPATVKQTITSTSTTTIETIVPPWSAVLIIQQMIARTICLPVGMYACSYIYLFICLYACPYIYLFICLYISHSLHLYLLLTYIKGSYYLVRDSRCDSTVINEKFKDDNGNNSMNQASSENLNLEERMYRSHV